MGPFLYYEDGRMSIKRDNGPMPTRLPVNIIRGIGYGSALLIALAVGRASGLTGFLFVAGVLGVIAAVIEAFVRDTVER